MSFGLFCFVVYVLALLFIFIYSLMQANLVYNYTKEKNCTDSISVLNEDNLPIVTIQLPIYNEQYVIERLMDCISNFDYPKELLEIQVLDDSTDITREIVAEKVRQLKDEGFWIDHIHRTDRSGYKAGALSEGLKISQGKFVAIFDADFTPKENFIRKTLERFTSDDVGMVQTKWGYINQDYSLLTKLQAFGLDGHFTIEQTGRSKGGHFINFNGTAGMWRKSCIEDAGGWKCDTLTEDLDLSYNAQLKGWRFVYLEHFDSPSELPVAMASLKSQQYRWTKGAAENAKKHLIRVFRSNLGFRTKLHALFHLMNSFIFICVLCSAFVSIPLLFFKSNHQEFTIFFNAASVLLVSFLILIVFYWAAFSGQFQSKRVAFKKFIFLFPAYLSISMGLSLHNSIAVVEAWLGRKTPFVRTPKYNLNDERTDWKTNTYFVRRPNALTLIEGALAIYFAYGISVAFKLNDYGLLPFHLMLTFGFGAIFFYSLKQSWLMK
ncbi:MAG: glycosyltransferase [Flavobacteriales bacterium]|nr:glycosyltransferase [Flavobacteriales bacterium]